MARNRHPTLSGLVFFELLATEPFSTHADPMSAYSNNGQILRRGELTHCANGGRQDYPPRSRDRPHCD
jgi:hypothetical protein